MKSWFVPTAFAFTVSLSGCGESPQPAPAGATPIAFSETPTLQYYLLASAPMSNGHRDALVQENGRNGLQTFMRYDVDCAAQQLVLVGYGGTVDAARRGEGAQPRALDGSSGLYAAIRGVAC